MNQSMPTAYQPQTDAQREVINKYISDILRAKLHHKGQDWVVAVPGVMRGMNSGVDSVREAAPHFLIVRFSPK